MFLLNSRNPLLSATRIRFDREGLHVPRACLLPKLRQQIAKFLEEGSLKRLGFLTPPTCVGFRYGHSESSTRGFSWKHGIGPLDRTRRIDPPITSRG